MNDPVRIIHGVLDAIEAEDSEHRRIMLEAVYEDVCRRPGGCECVRRMHEATWLPDDAGEADVADGFATALNSIAAIKQTFGRPFIRDANVVALYTPGATAALASRPLIGSTGAGLAAGAAAAGAPPSACSPPSWPP